MSEITRESLLERHGCPCPYCMRILDVHNPKLMPTRDHVQPKSRFKDGRIIVVCSECNHMKGDKTIEEFITDMVKKNLELSKIIKVNEQRLINLEYFFKMGLA